MKKEKGAAGAEVKKEVKTEKEHRGEQHRNKEAKAIETELVRDLKAQLK